MVSALRRRTVLSMGLVAAAVMAVGCSSTSAEGTSEAGAGAAAEAGALPVTIDHVHGSTSVEAVPQRVAAVGIGDADVLLALGVTPVLVPAWKGSVDTGVGEWAKPALAGATPPALANATAGFDVEKVAASNPDLIVAVNNAIDANVYGQLSAMAPTVLHAADQTDWMLPWQQVTTRIGDAVGRPAKAAEQVRMVEDTFARARSEHPEFAGKSAILVRYLDGDKFRAYSPTSARGQLLTELGFGVPAQLRDRFGDALYTEISAENLGLLEADLLVVDNYDAAAARLDALPTFTGLQVVRSGAMVGLDPVVSDAVSMPNPLTIPFSVNAMLEKISRTPVGA
ncbi:iron-siderophore ABC transporter substrate-binding protein [Rhodococcus tukisamuensis]|uniref:Iron complex transport system substrate-binding protein n=1 Tax=Rhodococcus tukisamuensis TaxID=168276 RepID=A0A1G6YHJ0_9NOCA|nr:iron-siderophore ABC transporter substrate-binding protein [Rhodococcus tukisamuensis]SDD89095.1 iron complex transport system substrate-binding protein [Rhodococcus tukisamuensis]